ncbi:hypothetical protein [uncultured Dokdonia sp.]|uniref:hypothetical protein n=1 Tax=uncultured Dokdonia sp. TaxID=575653 RepID=UPI002609B348|nr:hypothetical protein [uncultured Dokdonia sp.]
MRNQGIKLIYLLIIIICVFGCKKSIYYNLQGNWSMIESDKYHEIKIKDSTIRIFKYTFDFSYIQNNYKIKDDTFFLNIKNDKIYKYKYLINKINDYTYQLESTRDTIFLIKRHESDFTFDKITGDILDTQFHIHFNDRLVKTLDSMNIEVPKLNRILYNE